MTKRQKFKGHEIVRHPSFGQGEVTKVHDDGTITVDFGVNHRNFIRVGSDDVSSDGVREDK